MDNAIILANKESYAWNFSSKIQEYILKEKSSKIPLVEVLITQFRNGETGMEIQTNIRGKDVYYVAHAPKTPNNWWVELLLVKDLVLNSSARSLTFVLTDMYYSRQDRKDKSRVPISARALSKSISEGLKRIITMDLHSEQLQGFYPATTPVDNLHSFPEVVRYLVKNEPKYLENLLIMSPDAGGVNRAKRFLKKLEELTGKNCYDIGFMIKQRSKPGEITSMKYVGANFEGRNVLIIDDIIDSGGTLIKCVQEIRKIGAKKVYCYATHGLFSKGVDEISLNFDKILISNTHNQEKRSVEVIDMSPLFAEAIFRAQTNESVSELFN